MGFPAFHPPLWIWFIRDPSTGPIRWKPSVTEFTTPYIGSFLVVNAQFADSMASNSRSEILAGCRSNARSDGPSPSHRYTGITAVPENARRWPNIWLLLGQRREHWANVSRSQRYRSFIPVTATRWGNESIPREGPDGEKKRHKNNNGKTEIEQLGIRHNLRWVCGSQSPVIIGTCSTLIDLGCFSHDEKYSCDERSNKLNRLGLIDTGYFLTFSLSNKIL